MKRWQKITINVTKWLVLLVYLAVALAFASSKRADLVCKSVDVVIADSLENGFVTKRDVMRLFQGKDANPVGKPLNKINTLELEERLAKFNSIRDAQVYKTIDEKLVVRIEQRKPQVRIINRYGQSYYIDDKATIMPLSPNYTAHVLVINGHITEPFEPAYNTNILTWKGNSEGDAQPLINRLYDFAQFILTDKFWRAQIAQVYVGGVNEIELVPRVGSHIVLLGSLDNYEEKLENLKVFYEKALPAEGWNKYKLINLKYSNQILCTKK